MIPRPAKSAADALPSPALAPVMTTTFPLMSVSFQFALKLNSLRVEGFEIGRKYVFCFLSPPPYFSNTVTFKLLNQDQDF